MDETTQDDTALGSGRFYGKYRGVVVNNVDPEQRGRIMALVPDVSGLLPTTWALPCLPWGGLQTGMFTVPQIGAGVWIEFEQGDPDYPIWVGCFWGSTGEVPAMAHLAPAPISAVTLQTTLQNVFMISDVPGPVGGIVMKSATGASIVVNDVGITIQNGKGASIVMVGPSVTINGGALQII